KIFLKENTEIISGECFNKITKKRIKGCLPMHTFGHACRIDEIIDICNQYHINVIEDAAEGMGSYLNDKHLGTFGLVSAISFNGNKVMTTGGGGVILTNNDYLAKRAKHLTTQAKMPHLAARMCPFRDCHSFEPHEVLEPLDCVCFQTHPQHPVLG
ncbi:MAG: DegT/DnrJ/EryC1/StrS family aminotransferase, partial [Nannocystaceae bacterium]